MGLDMFLSVERSFYSYGNPKEQKLASEIGKLLGMDGFEAESVSFEVLYWRKANAIHAWFVKNVQDGVDDCKKYWVTKEKMRELADTCRIVLANKRKAEELLPPSGGFFFGSTELNEWYWQDIEKTFNELMKLLNNKEFSDGPWTFYYQSSW